MLGFLTDPQAWLSLVILTALEIVLGIDNIIFIALLVGRLPVRRQERARIVGLSVAMLTRIALLYSIVWVTHLTQPWFSVAAVALSGRDLILIGGGLFLLMKSVTEIHHTLEHTRSEPKARRYASFGLIVAQIAVIDIVLSLDSVFTAVGLANQLSIMVTAIIIAIVVMMLLARGVAAFIERYPTIKVLALAFLILIGAALIASGLHFEIPKGYLYFAMGFAVAVELGNIRLRRHLDARRRGRGRGRG
jgi:predicted tellurium resistance membrane protein TerC